MLKLGSLDDVLIIAVLLLVIFAPKRLPSMGQQLCEAVRIARSRGGITLLLFVTATVFILWLNLLLLLQL